MGLLHTLKVFFSMTTSHAASICPAKFSGAEVWLLTVSNAWSSQAHLRRWININTSKYVPEQKKIFENCTMVISETELHDQITPISTYITWRFSNTYGKHNRTYLRSSSSRIFSSSHMNTPARAASSFLVGAPLLCKRRHMLPTSVHLVRSEYRLEYNSPIWKARLSLWPVTKLQWLANMDIRPSFFLPVLASAVPSAALWSHASTRPTRWPSHAAVPGLAVLLTLLTGPSLRCLVEFCNLTARTPISQSGRRCMDGNMFAHDYVRDATNYATDHESASGDLDLTNFTSNRQTSYLSTCDSSSQYFKCKMVDY